MRLEEQFKNLDRKSQEYIINRLFKYAVESDSCYIDDCEKMYEYYYAMNIFDRFRLHLENINKQEKEEVLKLVYEYAKDIKKNGIHTYYGRLCDLPYCTGNSNQIITIMNMTINTLNYKRTEYVKEQFDKEAFDKYIDEWIEKNNLDNGYFIADFRDENYWYIALSPDIENVINVACQYDEYFRNNLDEKSLNLYKKLNTDQVLYLVGKIISLSREDLAKFKENRIKQDKLLKEKELKKHTRTFTKRKMPKIRQRKKQVTIIR